MQTANRRQVMGLLGGGILGAGVLGAATAAHAAGKATKEKIEDVASPWTRREHVDVAGGRIHCAIMGDGPGMPLVVFPKLGGWVADWAQAAAHISAKRQVIAIDFPGHGDSVMNGPAPYVTTMAESAAMTLSALDRLGIERFAVGGVSMGGVLSAYIAATSPDLVSHLVMISTQLRMPTSWQFLKEQDEQRATGGDKEGDPLTTEGLLKKFGTADMRVIKDRKAANERAGDWKRSCERGVGRLGIERYLSAIKAPTMWVTAEAGTYLRYTEVVKKHIPGVRVETVSNTGSFVQEEQPLVAAQLINNFIG